MTGDAPPPRRLRSRAALEAAVARREGRLSGRPAATLARRDGQRGGVRAHLPAAPARVPDCRYVPPSLPPSVGSRASARPGAVGLPSLPAGAGGLRDAALSFLAASPPFRYFSKKL